MKMVPVKDLDRALRNAVNRLVYGGNLPFKTTSGYIRRPRILHRFGDTLLVDLDVVQELLNRKRSNNAIRAIPINDPSKEFSPERARGDNGNGEN
jgi:ABC-type uncharacterized transport system ATPase subunit